MKTLDEIPAGESWATRFRTVTFLQDGVPVRPAFLAPGDIHPGQPSTYESIGIIVTRDRETQMLELQDTRSPHRFRVSYADCWAWDTIEWQEETASE